MGKRSALIASGCVLGTGGILLITPPAFMNSTSGISTAATPTTSTTAKANTSTTASTSTATTGKSGTFAGAAFNNQFGTVQVQITVANGKITAVNALQYPNQDYQSKKINTQAVPYLIQETLTAQSANISGVGGASYTSGSWKQSLASALAKAGL